MGSRSMKTALYRHFDAAGRLLYVGISLNAIGRLAQHRNSAQWFAEIARVDVEWLPTREAAIRVERQAIAKENPKCNIQRPGSGIAKTIEPHAWGVIHPGSMRIDGWYVGRDAKENAEGVLEYFQETWPDERFVLRQFARDECFFLSDSRVLRGTNDHLWAKTPRHRVTPRARAFAGGEHVGTNG